MKRKETSDGNEGRQTTKQCLHLNERRIGVEKERKIHLRKEEWAGLVDPF